MSSKTDQKSLELLYENIVEGSYSSSLCLKEELFIDILANKVYEDLKHHLNNPRKELYRFDIPFINLIPALNNDIIDQLDIEEKYKNSFKAIYGLKNPDGHASFNYFAYDRTKVKFVKDTKEQFVAQFQNYDHNQTIEIPFENKQRFIEGFKICYVDFVKNVIKGVYEDFAKGSSGYFGRNLQEYNDIKMFFEWREEQLKFDKLKEKLPEVEGLFD